MNALRLTFLAGPLVSTLGAVTSLLRGDRRSHEEPGRRLVLEGEAVR
jgi:hypothetical protein